jgi:pantothenate kinase
MTEAILLALWLGTSIFFICREIKTKASRRSHEYWLSELRECLHGIQNEFSRRCYEITENAFSLHNYSSYDTQISELKEEYINEVHNKIIARKGKYFLTTLPDHILEEYERNIAEIADIYHNILTINTLRRR